jgi:hypothetical protein
MDGHIEGIVEVADYRRQARPGEPGEQPSPMPSPGRGDAATNLAELERRLRFIGARGW